MNKLYIITGPAGVGKSTISYEIGKKLAKSVVIEGDTIYNFFVGGRIKPWYPDAPLNLFWSNCIMLIKSYLENGYDVVFNYIIENEELEKLKKEFKDYDISFTCLLVDEKTIMERDLLRPEDCRMHERSLILLKEFIDCNYDITYILDSSNLTIDETVEKILNK
mgnify:FL=1